MLVYLKQNWVCVSEWLSAVYSSTHTACRSSCPVQRVGVVGWEAQLQLQAAVVVVVTLAFF